MSQSIDTFRNLPGWNKTLTGFEVKPSEQSGKPELIALLATTLHYLAREQRSMAENF